MCNISHDYYEGHNISHLCSSVSICTSEHIKLNAPVRKHTRVKHMASTRGQRRSGEGPGHESKCEREKERGRRNVLMRQISALIEKYGD